MIAVRGKTGVVTAVDKVIASKLYLPSTNARVANADTHVGMAMAGLYPDCRSLLDYAVGEALDYLKEYRTPMPTHQLASKVRFIIATYNFITLPFSFIPLSFSFVL